MCPGSCPYPGVTNGYDWYTTSGNRQDFMNWYHGCREVTLELAEAKLSMSTFSTITSNGTGSRFSIT